MTKKSKFRATLAISRDGYEILRNQAASSSMTVHKMGCILLTHAIK